MLLTCCSALAVRASGRRVQDVMIRNRADCVRDAAFIPALAIVTRESMGQDSHARARNQDTALQPLGSCAIAARADVMTVTCTCWKGGTG